MLNLKELDSKHIELLKEQATINTEYEEIEGEIEELEMRKQCLESRSSEIQSEFKEIEKAFLKIKTNELDLKTDDKFLMNFIKVSWFCNRETWSPALQCVKINENSLIACDGYKVIRIKTEVPQEFKNTFVRWDIREDFSNNLESNIEKYPDVEKVIKDAKEDIKYTIKNLTSNNFYEKVKGEDIEHRYHNTFKLIYEDTNIAFNKEHMKVALSAIDAEFSLSIKSELEPLVLENENIEIIILPIRLLRS